MKKTYQKPSLKALEVYPLGATLNTVSQGQADPGDWSDGGGDVKGERPFSSGGRQRNLWDEAW